MSKSKLVTSGSTKSEILFEAFQKCEKAFEDARSYDEKIASAKTEKAAKAKATFTQQLNAIRIRMLKMNCAFRRHFMSQHRKVKELAKSEENLRQFGPKIRENLSKALESLLLEMVGSAKVADFVKEMNETPQKTQPIQNEIEKAKSECSLQVQSVLPTVSACGAGVAFTATTAFIGVGADAACGGAWCLPLTGAAALTGAPLIIAIGVTGGLAIWGLWSLIGWCVDKYRQMEMDKKMHALKASFDELLRTMSHCLDGSGGKQPPPQPTAAHLRCCCCCCCYSSPLLLLFPLLPLTLLLRHLLLLRRRRHCREAASKMDAKYQCFTKLISANICTLL